MNRSEGGMVHDRGGKMAGRRHAHNCYRRRFKRLQRKRRRCGNDRMRGGAVMIAAHAADDLSRILCSDQVVGH